MYFFPEDQPPQRKTGKVLLKLTKQLLLTDRTFPSFIGFLPGVFFFQIDSFYGTYPPPSELYTVEKAVKFTLKMKPHSSSARDDRSAIQQETSALIWIMFPIVFLEAFGCRQIKPLSVRQYIREIGLINILLSQKITP